MRYSRGIGAFVLGGCVIACSGAPSGDPSADFEINAKKARPPSSTDTEPAAGTTEAPPPPPPSDDNELPVPTTAPPPAVPTGPPPTVISLKIDGKELTATVDAKDLWVGVSGAGKYNAFIKWSGAGSAGSDLALFATHTGSGCVNTANYIAYRPSGDTQYMPKSVDDPACGLVIDELPSDVGGRFRGKFKGTLHGINVTPAKAKTVEVTFDILRTK